MMVPAPFFLDINLLEIRTMDRVNKPNSLAVVTGAAHRLGKAIALDLAQKGYAIGLHYYHSKQQAEITAQEFTDFGVPVILLPGDLTDPAQIVEIFKSISGCGYPLKILVNSASVMPHATLDEMETDEWDHTFNLNLRAPWLCSQAAARQMVENGLIVNITDTGAGRTWTGFPAYSISKQGLDTLTRLMARSLAPKIRVNAIAPGLILRAAEMEGTEWQRLVQRLPLKSAGSPEAVLKAIWYLIENEYVTGQTLVVDGGYQII
jgi:NAD(P)-dependent dehydrogenase (short-subunit alcohol dehydrogenase family)